MRNISLQSFHIKHSKGFITFFANSGMIIVQNFTSFSQEKTGEKDFNIEQLDDGYELMVGRSSERFRLIKFCCLLRIDIPNVSFFS